MKLTRLAKLIAVPAAVVLIAAVLTGCGGGKDASGELKIGYFNNVTHAQALYMKAEGTLEKAVGDKTNVEWVAFNAGPAEVEALFAGEIDIGYIGPVPAITANVKSSGDVKVISGASTAGAELLKAPGAKINSVSDLDGKTVAIPQIGNTQHLCLLKILSDNDLETTDNGGTVTVIEAENADVQNLMDRGEIDAALVPEPWGTILEKNGAKTVLDYDEVYAGGDYPVAVVVARSEVLENNPEIVEKFLNIHKETTDKINADTDKCAAVVNEEINEATGKKIEADVLDKAFDRIGFSTEISEKSMKEFAKIALEQKFIDENYTGIFADMVKVK